MHNKMISFSVGHEQSLVIMAPGLSTVVKKNLLKCDLQQAQINFVEISSTPTAFLVSILDQSHSLTNQNKILDIVNLEQQCPLWRRLMCGLPLLFLLWAGCDTLAQWNIILNPVCSLCYSSPPISPHCICMALLLAKLINK